MLEYFEQARRVAISGDAPDKRNFILGAVGVREDGAVVSAKNGAVISSTYDDYRIISDAHAEVRCLRKSGKNATLYVVRVLKRDGSLAMAKACCICQLRIKAAEVKKVYYSINEKQFGIWIPKTDKDRVYNY